jgi:hypothetical protein
MQYVDTIVVRSLNKGKCYLQYTKLVFIAVSCLSGFMPNSVSVSSLGLQFVVQ